MITREQFEAHVRAEAEAIYTPLMEGATIYDNAHDANEPSRLAYIAARMEHEWPLVEALIKIRKWADHQIPYYGDSEGGNLVEIKPVPIPPTNP